MRYLSVCSGIEAASVAWGPLGWQAVAFSEIEPFPSAALTYHYPVVPNLGDMTTIAPRILTGEVEAPDMLVGGTPCQSFSIAGLRKSLADERGNLTLQFVELANAIDQIRTRDGRPPTIIIWENVPGVLSTKDNAFGCFLAGLAGEDCPLEPPGGKWKDAGAVYGPKRAIAWRVLDAQYFGLAQRRRRVFVVASAREGFDPAAVLFEFEGVRRDTAPSREKGEEVTHDVAPCVGASGRGFERAGETRGQDPVVAYCRKVSPTLTNKMQGSSGWAPYNEDAHLVPVYAHAHAFKVRCGCEGGGKGYLGSDDMAFTLSTGADQHLLHGMSVRRLTPRECERLMGFPDDYTLIPWRGKPASECPDGPRYKALGNSWAVPELSRSSTKGRMHD